MNNCYIKHKYNQKHYAQIMFIKCIEQLLN